MMHLMRLFPFLLPVLCFAQNPMSDAWRRSYGQLQQNLTEAVEQVHEGYLDFRPTAEVRTFREMAGHILDTNNMVCAALKGEAAPPSLEKSPMTKAELIAAVKRTNDYCDPVVKGLTDADLATSIKLGPREGPKAVPVMIMLAHSALHYGNLVTYMRLRGMAPPETERSGQKAEPAKTQMVQYYMGFLRKGPKWTPEVTEETKKIQEGHLAHMRKSHEAGALVLAGPFGDDGDIRGILIYKTKDIEEARKWANADPAVVAGRLVLEIHPWWVEKGYLP